MRTIVLAVLFLFSAAAGWASERVALVIGNGEYAHQPKLRNPVADARAIAAKLDAAGFKVTTGTDLSFDDMRRTINDFAATVPNSKAAVLFFAGHGIQVDGENYLVPVDADIQRTADLTWQTVAVSTLIAELEGTGRTSIIILDACRNNPGLARRLRGLSSRSRTLQVGTGLAQVSAPDGSYVAFSTAPHTVARDGDGTHSPFAEALLKHLPTPGLDIALMMRRVRGDVRRATNSQQTPWDSSSLTRPFYFYPKAVRTERPQARPATGLSPFELSYWDSVKNSGNPRLLDSYLDKYPKGHFADLARTLIGELGREKAGEDRKATEERKARAAAADRRKARREEEAALRKANEARRESEYKKALADAEAAKQAQQAAEAKLAAALAEARKAQQQAVEARKRRQEEIEKADQEARVASLPKPTRTEPEQAQEQEARHRALQTALQKLGCYRAPVDGLWGPASQRALERSLGTARARAGASREVLEAVRTSGKRCETEGTAGFTATVKRRARDPQNTPDCRQWRHCVSTQGRGEPRSKETAQHCLFQPRGCVY